MDIYNKIIGRIIEENIFVSIYTDFFNETLSGYIVKISKDLLMLESFDDNSLVDGIKIIRLSDITRIRWGNKELHIIEKLINNETRIKGLNDIQIDDIRGSINSVQNIFGYVGIYTQEVDPNICMIGEMKEIDDDSILIEEFRTIQSLDRTYLFMPIQDITRIDAGGLYEENLKKIYLKI